MKVQEDAASAPARYLRSHLGPLFEPDPVLLHRPKPNASIEVTTAGRRFVMEVDEMGCRAVLGQPSAGEKTLTVYGCSFTFGFAVAAGETFCSLLQQMFPNWRVENHGAPGYGQSQNLIQLERDTRWYKPELVTFCWIGGHLRRNVAEISWVQRNSSQADASASSKIPDRRVLRATLNRNGDLHLRLVRVPRPDLVGIDLSDFAPDAYYLDLICFRLFERASTIVKAYGGHFFVTTLRDQLSARLAGQLADRGIPVVDASLSGEEYDCLPGDHHPNALANRIYAERIGNYLSRLAPEQGTAS